MYINVEDSICVDQAHCIVRMLVQKRSILNKLFKVFMTLQKYDSDIGIQFNEVFQALSRNSGNFLHSLSIIKIYVM